MDQADERRRSLLRLHLAAGVGPVRARRLLEHFGRPERVAAASAGDLRQVDGIGPKVAEAIRAVDDAAVEEELALARAHAAEVVCIDDAGYPAALKTIYDAPLVLYVRGRLVEADAVAMAVVGSRRCTHYGLEQADRFGALLGRAGFTVVSGGARGIDAAAHRGALAAGGRTVAVMGCGLARLYPPENAPLFEQILRDGRGALISELPMRTDVKSGNFPTRNRIISGLSLGVVIVEAARNSGSLITARSAIDQGREVFAVPGRVDSPFSEGTNALIAAHEAVLTRDLDDILNALDRVGESLREAGAPEAVAAAARPDIPVDETESALLALLAGQDLTLDELVRRSNLPSPKVIAAMTTLGIKRLVTRQAGGVFSIRTRPDGSA